MAAGEEIESSESCLFRVGECSACWSELWVSDWRLVHVVGAWDVIDVESTCKMSKARHLFEVLDSPVSLVLGLGTLKALWVLGGRVYQ